MSSGQRNCRARGGWQNCRFHNAAEAERLKTSIGEKQNELVMAVAGSFFMDEEGQSQISNLKTELQELKAEYDATEEGVETLLNQMASKKAKGQPTLELQIRHQLAVARMDRNELALVS